MAQHPHSTGERESHLSASATSNAPVGQPTQSPISGAAPPPSLRPNRNFLYRWEKNFFAAINEDSGWRLAGKLFALTWGLAGLWLTWQTFQTNVRLEQLRHAEE